MEPKLPEHFSISHRFNDFEAFCEAASGWELEFHQLDRGSFQAEMDLVVCGPSRVARCRFSRKLQQLGASPPDHWTFGVPVDSHMRYRWRNREVKSDHVIGFDPSTELDSVSDAGFHIFSLSFSQEAANRLAEESGLRPLEDTIGRRGVAVCSEERIQALRQTGAAISQAVRENPEVLDNSAFRRELRESLPALIIETFDNEKVNGARPQAKYRTQALKRALAVIGDRAHEPVSVTELYRLCGASGRTVRYAFEENFGLSPKAYLQAHRLNRVRSELLRATPENKGAISNIANRWGFWHMGQFAADYRRMFGELPSETLARRRS